MRTFLNTMAAILVIGCAGLGVAYAVAPSPVLTLWERLHDRVSWPGMPCSATPVACLDERTGSLRRRQGEVREARTMAETGLRSLDTEEARVRNLLDANLGQQALLRSRTNDALLRGAERLTFVGRTYAMGDVAAQAASLVAEQQQYENTVSVLLPPRRDALLRARQQSMLADNSITTTLATADADRALVMASQSMERTSRLLAEIAGTDQKAAEALSTVRTTLELSVAEPPAKPAPGGPAAETFDFNAWRNGRSVQGGG